MYLINRITCYLKKNGDSLLQLLSSLHFTLDFIDVSESGLKQKVNFDLKGHPAFSRDCIYAVDYDSLLLFGDSINSFAVFLFSNAFIRCSL